MDLSEGQRLEFLILGPLQVRRDGREVPLQRRMQRALLALLLLHANEVVSQDRLIDALWGDEPPRSATASLQNTISQLRKVIGRDRLLTEPPGYRLRVAPNELDLERFERLVADARAATEPSSRPERLHAALALWRGAPLAEFEYDGFVRGELDRLEELRLGALEERIEGDLELGRHLELIAELEELVASHPYRERLRGLLMLALYRSGRQADALAAYRAGRQLLVEELGIDPGPALQVLERQILAQDENLQPPVSTQQARRSLEPPPPAHPPAAVALVRRTVTVLFCDVVGSTSLGERVDPEVLQDLMSRYFDKAHRALERHGGRIEKFIGDAVMAVFGLPELHEDDALRAVRAAAELRESLSSLNDELERVHGARIEIRIGINTGEVVAGDPSGGQRLVTGDAVNVAARLEQAAGPGTILLGPVTERLVRDAAVLEAVEPLELPGKRDRLPAWKLVDVRPHVPAGTRRLVGRFVGRGDESRALLDAFDAAVREPGLWLVTVVGAAGIGKSRLANELMGSVGDSARTLVGRCIPYGEGITYWPLAEMVRELPGANAHERVLSVAAATGEAELIAGIVASAVGNPEDVSTAGQSEETAWAFRRLFEGLARDRPLVAIFDDIQWAEPTLLDLLEYTASFSSGAPILLLCLARPDIFERHPTWSEPRPNARVVTLNPLSDADSEELIDDLLHERELPEKARAQILAAAEGNPLFVEQMLAMQIEEDPGAEMVVPPTIQALLAARLDRLEPEERAALERASVEGRLFHRSAVGELLPAGEEEQLGTRLVNLVRKQLIRADRSLFPGDDGFSFGHILIREAAYASMPKQLRAELHERLARWLERKAGERLAEYEELLGHHLEQAFLYRAELQSGGKNADAAGERAAVHLTRAGERSLERGDLRAAINLLGRAVAAAPVAMSMRPAILEQLGEACWEAGEFERAASIFQEAIALAVESGDRRSAARASVGLMRVRSTMQGDPSSAGPEADRLISVLEELGDDLGLAGAWLLLVDRHNFRLEPRAAISAAEQALAHARKAGAKRVESEAMGWIATIGVSVLEPASETARRLEQILEESQGPAVEAHARVALGVIRALQGEILEARGLFVLAREAYRELGMDFWAVGIANLIGPAELAVGDLTAAEAELRASAEELEEMGEASIRSTVLAFLARTLCLQGHDDEAERLASESLSLSPGDVVNEIICAGVNGLVAARRGDLETAVALVSDALDRYPVGGGNAMEADTQMDLAEVMRLAGRHDDSVAALQDALRLYEEKEDVASAERARRRLAQAVV